MNSAFQGTTLQNFALLPVILSDPGQSIVITSIPFDPRVLSRPNHAATVFRFASSASALLCGCSVEMEDHKMKRPCCWRDLLLFKSNGIGECLLGCDIGNKSVRRKKQTVHRTDPADTFIRSLIMKSAAGRSLSADDFTIITEKRSKLFFCDV